MLNFNQFKSQNIGIYGLGITGSSIAETLKFNGANVYIWDDNPEIRRKFIKKNFILKEIEDWPWSDLYSFFPSPGIDLKKVKLLTVFFQIIQIKFYPKISHFCCS